MPDIYDREVERLTANPKEILNDWHRCGILFRFVCPSLRRAKNTCGCLVGIRGGDGFYKLAADRNNETAWGFSEEAKTLTLEIRADERIPDDVSKITAESLPVFAEWQRKLDAYYGREAPKEG